MSDHEAARVEAALVAQDWRATGELSLRGLGLRELPRLPDDAARLRSLDLSGNRLTELPEQVPILVELERLDLAGNRLSTLPAAIGALRDLEELNLSENRLTELPAALAADAPAADAPNAAPQGLGALAVRRIEHWEGGLYFFGPRHVACYDAKTFAFRWLQVGNNILDVPSGQAFPSSEALWSEGTWRPAVLGSQRSTAIGQRRLPHPSEAAAPKAIYGLLFNNLREGTQCDVAAFDAQGGQVLWRTLAREELRDRQSR